MSPEGVLRLLEQSFPDAVSQTEVSGPHPHAVVDAGGWRAVAQFLRDDPRLQFDWLRCITGVDLLEDGLLVAIYELHATAAPPQPDGAWTLRSEIAIRVPVERDDPRIPSVADIWPSANWHEREAYDLLGIRFEGHPDLRRILCCDDWVGHPLRKDYEFPLEYNGIPGVTEYGQTRPQH